MCRGLLVGRVQELIALCIRWGSHCACSLACFRVVLRYRQREAALFYGFGSEFRLVWEGVR